jgi:hypothetical protein
MIESRRARISQMGGAWMRYDVKVILLLCAVSVVGCQGEIPLVGLDANGKQIETMAKRADFENYLTTGLNDLQESIIPSLDQAPSGRDWFLREVRVGLGVQGSVGLGEFFKLGGNVGFRLFFADKP